MISRSRQARRRRPGLTRADVLAAAARILERDGYDALTTRNLAAELGVKSASLYWHFRTKEELEDLLADEMLADFNVDGPSRDDWQEELREGAFRFFKHLLSKRDVGRLCAGRLVTGPNTLRWMERGLGIFRRAGLNDRDAAFASHAVHVYIQGFVIFQQAPLSALQAKGLSPAEILNATKKTFARLPAATYPNIVALADALTEGDPDGRFLFGLDCLIAGIVQRRLGLAEKG
jgi:TetR/AcrR family tetracycline transcriptional repressor